MRSGPIGVGWDAFDVQIFWSLGKTGEGSAIPLLDNDIILLRGRLEEFER